MLCYKCGEERDISDFYVYGERIVRPCKICKQQHWRSEEYKTYRRRQQRRLKYNVPHEEILAQLELQDFRCGICSVPMTEDKLCVDHDHKTGKPRGLLCYACNSGIGQLKDDIALLEQAIKYLKGGKWTTDVDSLKSS